MSAAPVGAKEQVARLLTLVPYLHAHGEVRLDEAATALGTDPDQLLRDLKVLFMCGLPGGYPDDLIDVDLDALEGEDGVRTDGVIRVSNADYLARPLRLSPTEASAIIVALRALRNGSREATREVVDRALAKLETAAAEGPRVDPGQDAADADLALLARRLQGAADEGRQVRLGYYVPARDEQSERVVDPRGVVAGQGETGSQGSHLYLDAWCHSAEAPRLFRLDRIEHAEVLDTPVVTAPEPPRDLAAGIFAQSSDVVPVTLELGPRPTGSSTTTRSRKSGPTTRTEPPSCCSSPTSAGSPGCCSAWRRTPGSCRRRSSPRRSQQPHTAPSASTTDQPSTVGTTKPHT